MASSRTLSKSRVTPSRRSDALRTELGKYDVLPKENDIWKLVSQTGQTISDLHDFSFIDTSLLEEVDVFRGARAPFVQHQQHSHATVATPHGKKFLLTPHGALGIIRSFVEHRFSHGGSPLKLFHYGPVFRSSALRTDGVPHIFQSREWGFHIIGETDTAYDMQILLAVMDFLTSLKFKKIRLRINMIGCRVCAPVYRTKLRDYYFSKKTKLCDTCKASYEMNPFSVFSCLDSSCLSLRGAAPIILDYLCQNCNNYFKFLLELLEDNAFLYVPDPYYVPDFSYYNRAVFQVFADDIEEPLASGGRYDYLAEMLGIRFVPSVGAMLHVDHIMSILRIRNPFSIVKRSRVFFAAVGEQAKKSGVKLMYSLRSHGVPVTEALSKRSLSAQLRVAERFRVPLALILGQKEVFEGTVLIKDMATGIQETIVLDNMIEGVKKRLKAVS